MRKQNTMATTAAPASKPEERSRVRRAHAAQELKVMLESGIEHLPPKEQRKRWADAKKNLNQYLKQRATSR